MPVVDGVSFTAAAGRTLGMEGGSGSGKSTIAKAIFGLVPVAAGSIRFLDQELVGLSEREWRPFRKEMQMIFQDPRGSLNPQRTVLETLGEPMEIHFPERRAAERRERVAALLERVGLPADAMGRYPAAFSGGQRQRIGIARALAVEPRLIVCDECVSALDVSVQAQIINLLQDLQAALGLTCIFISHDPAVVEHVSHDLVVIRNGRVVAFGPAADRGHPQEQSQSQQLSPGQSQSGSQLH